MIFCVCKQIVQISNDIIPSQLLLTFVQKPIDAICTAYKLFLNMCSKLEIDQKRAEKQKPKKTKQKINYTIQKFIRKRTQDTRKWFIKNVTFHSDSLLLLWLLLYETCKQFVSWVPLYVISFFMA